MEATGASVLPWPDLYSLLYRITLQHDSDHYREGTDHDSRQIREKFHLKVGDQIEFDESAPVLTARRVVDRAEWGKTLGEWQKAAAKSLKNHPWEKQRSAAIVDELRGGPR